MDFLLKIFTVRRLRYLIIALSVGLVISALYLVRSGVSYALYSPADTAIKGDKAPEARGKKDFDEYGPILTNNAFGFAPSELVDLGGGEDAEEKAAPSELTLIGTVAGRSVGFAIMADRSGSQEVYRLWDEIPGMGAIKEVLPDRVVFTSGTELALADIATIKEGTSGYKPTGSPARDNGFVRKTDDKTYMIDQNAIQAALENPQQIMTDARLLPNMVDGRQEGYIIKSLRRGGIYQNLGLKKGDILYRVNEYDISNPEAALQAFTALRGMDRVQLDVLRGGSKMTLTYIIR